MLMLRNCALRQAFNSLVDQCNIEKNCVFPSKAEAEQVCLKGRDGKFEVSYNSSMRPTNGTHHTHHYCSVGVL